jgi:hypothetical protein
MLRHSRDAQANTGVGAEAEPHTGVMERLQVLLIGGDGRSVASRIGEPSGRADAAPCLAFGFQTGQARPRRRFRDHRGCRMRIEQTRGHT